MSNVYVPYTHSPYLQWTIMHKDINIKLFTYLGKIFSVFVYVLPDFKACNYNNEINLNAFLHRDKIIIAIISFHTCLWSEYLRVKEDNLN